MKKYTGNYIIRWTDKSGNSNKKVYDDYSTVIKARKWLIENEATDIDIAVQVASDIPHFSTKKYSK